ncbi:hypothetical protein BGX27_006441, partial [Mortierella sp. AM989]
PGRRFIEGRSVILPAVVWSSLAYRQQLYMKFRALFDRFGTPTLFATFTCNLQKPIYRNLVNQFYGTYQDPLRDPALIAKAFQRDFQDFFKFVKGPFANR